MVHTVACFPTCERSTSTKMRVRCHVAAFSGKLGGDRQAFVLETESQILLRAPHAVACNRRDLNDSHSVINSAVVRPRSPHSIISGADAKGTTCYCPFTYLWQRCCTGRIQSNYQNLVH